MIIILLPILLSSFLSVGYSQLSDSSIISMSGSGWSLKVDGVLQSSLDSKNTPYMTSKTSTEKELFLELASLEDCKSGVVQFKVDTAGLTAYKQLPLTQEEINEGSFRPKNVENSFALFDDSSKKVAHIYGSKITDSKGIEIWLDQNLQDGLLTVILPKPEVLETLSFPLLLDPIFGYQTVGASATTTYQDGKTTTTMFTLPEDGTVNNIYVYLSVAAGDGVIDVGLYNSTGTTPDKLMFKSSTLTSVTNTAYQWFNFTFSEHLDAGDYWLGFGNNSTDYDVRYKYDTVAVNQTIRNSVGYLPSSIVDGSPVLQVMTIFADYVADPEATPSLSPTATPFPERAMDDTDWWISILVLLLIIINIFLMMLPFAAFP